MLLGTSPLPLPTTTWTPVGSIIGVAGRGSGLALRLCEAGTNR